MLAFTGVAFSRDTIDVQMYIHVLDIYTYMYHVPVHVQIHAHVCMYAYVDFACILRHVHLHEN